MMSKLEASAIRQPLTSHAAAKLDQLNVFDAIASTNSYLLAVSAPSPGRFRVAIADHQTAGRGRRDRRWKTVPGAGLCLSFAYTFARMPDQLPALTLAIGVGVVAALRKLNIGDVSLKWPNDVVAPEGKLGGILTEVRSGAGKGVTVVTGIGLNVHIPEHMDIRIESEWAHRAADLRSICAQLPARELLAGTIIDRLYETFPKFEAQGFAGFSDAWQQQDWLRGREITVDTPKEQVSGIAAGVDADGALLVDTKSGQVRIVSGSITLAEPTKVDQ
jgi:BirA family biotin operon repressor/biotin-[acetyl-CoA-carboxylase] ligase